MEYVDKSFRFGVVRTTRLRLIWCHLFDNKEKDIQSFIFGKREELLRHSMHFILHVLDGPLGSEIMDPCFFAM